MRLLFRTIAPLMLLTLVLAACSWVDPSECWVNTSGGLGGEGPIPIGAGVGATTGGDFSSPPDPGAPPPSRPLDDSGRYNPCMATPSQPDKCQFDRSPLEHGATLLTCSDACRAPCGPNISVKFVDFSPSDFPFVTTIRDNGSGPAGGWQVAKPKLEFKRYDVYSLAITLWYCDFNIEMPLRTELMGKVDATRAANLSVEITEAAASQMDYKLPQGIFCSQFIQQVDMTFKSTYPKLGATAVKK